MRDAWLPLGLVVLVGAAAPLACGQAFELTGSTGSGMASATGTGGSSAVSAGSSGGASSSVGGASSSAASGSTGTSGGKTCTVAAECGGMNTLCGEVVCMDGHCAIHQLQQDGPSFSQLYGDCRTTKCAKAKISETSNNNDVYDDGNPCTIDSCEGGVPSNKPNVGATCHTTDICNDKGICVECSSNHLDNCTGEKPACIGGRCMAVTCQDQNKDLTETDVDCGGDLCGPCDDGKYCNDPSDCTSGVCQIPNNENKLKCIVASCVDTVKNGKETDTDCGGPDCQKRCPVNGKCAVGSDCFSKVCQSGICQIATCTDGVKNGAESGIDCGAQGCALAKCPGG